MDTTLYLNIPTIGVTGSFGKTSVKEITAAILSEKYKTSKSRGNFNMVGPTKNHVKRITDEHEAVVIEMGMGRQGAGRRHCTAIQPNIGVITAIGHAHFERLTSIQSTILAKSEMMKYMNPTGTLYLNYDDEYSKLIDTKYFSGNVIKVGTSHGANYRATDITTTKNGMEFNVILSGVSERMFLPIFGDHSVVNALFGIAIADKLNITPDEIREGLKKVELPRGRLTLNHLHANRILLDDTANANPVSMIAGLKVLNDYDKNYKKIALLGDMAELGSYTKEGHEKVGSALNDFNLDKVYLYGDSSKWILKKAVETGFPKEKISYFKEMTNLIEEVEKNFINDTALLAKASKATHFGKVVKHLKSEFDKNK